jgi:hypothetical protein
LKVKSWLREASGCSKEVEIDGWNLEEVQFNKDFE